MPREGDSQMNRNKFFRLSAAVVCFSLAACVLLPSDSKKDLTGEYLAKKSLSQDVGEAVYHLSDDIYTEIFSLPKVYTLPWTLAVPPQPNPDGFKKETYEDKTITVKCWKEFVTLPSKKTVHANFADIKVGHPTQLRTAFAGGNYGNSKREYTTVMAAANHAILAINADFYNCRTGGVILRQNILYRSKPFGIDTLMIDNHGNFIVMEDNEIIESHYLENHEIYQTIAFGPWLVKDGKAIHKKMDQYKSVSCGQYANNPRTAIGQLGELHYLVCTVDGRSSLSSGCTTNELADIMEMKKCVTAYNLDGGQSTDMVFHDKIYNAVSNGGERKLSDIIYFATALPEEEWD